MTKEETLKAALQAREEEVLHYQVNIENYVRAIERSKSDPELSEFTKLLGELLASSRLEQKKATIMLDVIREQLEI